MGTALLPPDGLLPAIIKILRYRIVSGRHLPDRHVINVAIRRIVSGILPNSYPSIIP
jgi:hypothetical protein